MIGSTFNSLNADLDDKISKQTLNAELTAVFCRSDLFKLFFAICIITYSFYNYPVYFTTTSSRNPRPFHFTPF